MKMTMTRTCRRASWQLGGRKINEDDNDHVDHWSMTRHDDGMTKMKMKTYLL